MDYPKGRAPWHVWAVGVVSLLWNLFGANDFYQTQTGNREYVADMAGQIGATPDEVIGYFQAYPLWLDIFWAAGVFGAVAGSVLLLLRNRFAVLAFAVSLVGLAVTTLYQLVVGQPDWMTGTTNAVMAIVIWSIATFLLIYAASMRRRGVLR